MKKWLGIAAIVIGFVAFAVLVWFAFPFIGFGSVRLFDPVWVRILIISIAFFSIVIWQLLKWRKRKKAQAALEEALTEVEEIEGDGAVLAEKMKSALATLKSSSSTKTYLYDMPWYVIIGPPGAGKTTALLNSEIKFPLAKDDQAAMSGVGGTRYCDWWFAEEAIIIDTAGRYTTQESVAGADSESWMSFLNLLKRNRPNQPINGVILAFSVQDLMNSDADGLKQHAKTIRARLSEVHETLKVDFPVYVMFTKADLISGFREYFGSFSASRRRKVWGTTFQNKNANHETYRDVGTEFDALISRLSDEVTDRLTEEPDGISRISIFGLPGQMAMLKDKITGLLDQVFEPTKYKSSALLRGFYFTSGTQEGTPIDQVLGEMGRSFGGSQGSMMSGKGKSFFLHDLLQSVIFSEEGWVTYDRKAKRRSDFMRYGVLGVLAAGILGLASLWGVSYYNNKNLLNSVQTAIEEYKLAAGDELIATEVTDGELLDVSGYLNILRKMPAGVGEENVERGFLYQMGLGQARRLHSAAEETYRDGLERMFRTRLIQRTEQQLQSFVNANDSLAVYETLKVYKLLGGAAPISDDKLVKSWFHADWREELYPGPSFKETREDLQAHLDTLLKFETTPDSAAYLSPDLIDVAERSLAIMSVSEMAYSLVKATSEFSGFQDYNLLHRTGPEAATVFETVDGSELESLIVPALYTYNGFNEFFLDQLGDVAKKLEDEKWVMGKYAEQARISDQVGNLGPKLLARYRDEFIEAWNKVLDNIKLAPLNADKPVYRRLAAASAPTVSPILLLVESIADETMLTRDASEAGGGSTGVGGLEVDSEAAKQAQAAVKNRLIGRVSGLQRIGLELALGSKSSRRAGAGSGGGSAPRVPGQEIEVQFKAYHALLKGPEGSRLIDVLLGNLESLQQNLIIAGGLNGGQANAQLPGQLGMLRSTATKLPDVLSQMVFDSVDDFESEATNSSISQLNTSLSEDVTQTCKDIISNRFPFSNSPNRQVPMGDFGRLFAPGGILDTYFNENLARYADMTGATWTWKADSPVAKRFSANTLRQFQRAEAIREAFFPSRGSTPAIEFSIQQTSIHNRVRRAELEINGQTYTTRREGNVPFNFTWPGGAATGSTSLSFKHRLAGRPTVKRGPSGPWAFMQFIRQGSPKRAGEATKVRYTIGGLYVDYEIRVNSLVNPFSMRELYEFKCPSGL